MATEFKGYVSKDGKPFDTQIEAVTHEVKLDLEKSFPQMRTIINTASGFDMLMRTLLPLLELMQEDPGSCFAKPPEKSEDHPESQWPEAVRDAMSEDNLGEPTTLEHVSFCGARLPDVVVAQTEGKPINPLIRDVRISHLGLRCLPDAHDWQQTDNPLIDKCAVCGEERA